MVSSLMMVAQMLPVVLAAQRDRPTPKDSFLIHQVNSVKELVSEIQNHPGVRTHYSRLFHLPAPKVESYIAKNLVLTHLQHDYRHIVYCVTPRGVIFTVYEVQPAGDPVFATRAGQPVLRWACGNPFSANLPKGRNRYPPAGTVTFTGSAQKHPKAASKTGNGHGARRKDAAIHDVVESMVVSSVDGIDTYTPTKLVQQVPHGSAGRRGAFPISPFLSIIPISILVALDSGGGSPGSSGTITSVIPLTPTTPTGPRPSAHPLPAPTPEPATTTVLAIAGSTIAALVFARSYRRRRKGMLARECESGRLT